MPTVCLTDGDPVSCLCPIVRRVHLLLPADALMHSRLTFDIWDHMPDQALQVTSSNPVPRSRLQQLVRRETGFCRSLSRGAQQRMRVKERLVSQFNVHTIGSCGINKRIQKWQLNLRLNGLQKTEAMTTSKLGVMSVLLGFDCVNVSKSRITSPSASCLSVAAAEHKL